MKLLNSKKIIVLAVTIVSSSFLYGQDNSVGINTRTPNAKAVLELVSPESDQGFLVPRLSSAERSAMSTSLTSMEDGLMVFDTDNGQFYFWSNGDWKAGLGLINDLAVTGDLNGNYPNLLINTAAVVEDKIADGAVTTAKIADGNISTVKIADGAVTTVKLADLSVTGAKLEDIASISAGTYGADAFNVLQLVVDEKGRVTGISEVQIQIGTENIRDGSILNEDIANSTITISKLDNEGNTGVVLTVDENGVPVWVERAAFTSSNLSLNNFYVGNSDGVAQGLPVAGDVSVTNTGTAADIQINEGAIGSPEILNNSITSDDIATDAVNSEEIVAQAVGNSELADDAVTNQKIADNAIQTENIVDSNVTTTKVADDNITLEKIQNGTADQILGTDASGNPVYIDQTAIVVGTATDLVATSSVVSDEEVDNDLTIDGGDIDNSTIDASVIGGSNAAAATFTDLTASGNVSLGNNAIETEEITDGTILAIDLADEAVTTPKIADGNVTTPKINDAAVTTAKIADANITTSKIADGNVVSTKIADDNVTLSKIENGTANQVLTTNAAGDPVYVDQSALTVGTANDLVASTSVVSDSEVDDDLTINGGDIDNSTIDASVIGAETAAAATVTDLTATGAVDLGTDAIQADEIEANAVGNSEIQNDAVTSAKILDREVSSLDIALQAVTQAELADDAVTTAKILDDAVTKEKINEDVAGQALVQNGDGSLDVNIGNGLQITSDVLAVNLGDLAGDGIVADATDEELDINVDDATLEVTATDVLQVKDLGIVNSKIANRSVTFNKISGEFFPNSFLITNPGELASWFTPGQNQVIISGSSGAITTRNLTDFATDDLNFGSIFLGDATNKATQFPVSGGGNFIIGNGTSINSVPISGDLNISSIGTATIQDNAVDGTDLDLTSDFVVPGSGSVNLTNDGGLNITTTLDVSGATTTDGITNDGAISTTTLAVSGASTTTGITNTGDISTTGNTQIDGNLQFDAAGNPVDNIVTAIGTTGLDTNLPTEKAVRDAIANSVTADNGLTEEADGNIKLGGPLTEETTVTNDGFALIVEGGAGDVTFNADGSITAGNGVAVTGGNLDVTNDANITTNLDVAGATTTDGITNDGNINTTTLAVSGASTTKGITNTGDIASGTLQTSGAATLNSAAVTTTLDVSGATTTDGITNDGAISTTTLAVSGASTTTGITNTGDISTTGNTQIDGNLQFDAAGNPVDNIVTAIGPTGLDTNLPTEKAVRDAIANSVTADNGLTEEADGNIKLGGPLTEETTVTNDGFALIVEGGAGDVTFNADGSVTAGNGVAVTGGNLDVTNDANITTNLDVAGATTTDGITNDGAISTTTLAVSGASTTTGITNTGDVSSGTLQTSGAATLNSAAVTTTLDVSGASTTTGITNTGDISTTGNTQIDGNLQFDAAGNPVDNIVTAIGPTGLDTNLPTEKAVRDAIANSVTADNGLTEEADGNIKLGGPLTEETTVTNDGFALIVEGGAGDVTFNADGSVTAGNGVAVTGGNLDVTNDANITTNLDVAGATTTDGITNDGAISTTTLAVSGASTTTGITNTGDVSSGTLQTSGAATLNSAAVTTTLDVSGASTTTGITNTGDISTTGNTQIDGNLQFDAAGNPVDNIVTAIGPTGLDTNLPTEKAVRDAIANSVTADNGLTEEADGNIKLGGPLTEETTVTNDGFALIVEGGAGDVTFNADGSITAGNGVAVTGGNLDVTNDANITTNLDVAGATTTDGITNDGNINTTTLAVSGASTTTGITNTGDIASGTLQTSGAATLNSAAVTTTLDVSGATTTDGITNDGAISTTTLAVSGASTTTGITNTGDISTTGNTQIDGNLQFDAAGNPVDNIVTAIGPTGLDTNLPTEKAVRDAIANSVTADNGLTEEADGNIKLGGPLTEETTVTNDGFALIVEGGAGDVTFNADGSVTAGNGVAVTGGNLDVTNDANITSNLDVSGATTTDGITNDGAISTTTLAVSGASTTTGITNTGDISTTGNTQIDGNLQFDAAGNPVDNIVTAIGTTGLDTNLPTEKAVRDAIANSVTADNGLTEEADGNIKLGGPLTEETTVTNDGFALIVEGGSGDVTFNADGSVTSGNGVAVTGGNLDVTNDANITSNLDVSGATTTDGITNDGAISTTTLAVSGASTTTGITNAGDISTTGNTQIDGNLQFDAAGNPVDNIVTAIGTTGLDTNLPTEKAVRDAIDLEANDLQSQITSNDTDINDLVSLSGQAANATNFGTTFSGGTIPDAANVTTALQSLETSLENQTDDQLANEVAYTNTTSGLTATDVQGALDEIDGNVDTNDTDIAANAGNITTNTTDIGNLETLSGVAGGTDLGTFTGVTIADASDVKGALQSLETSLENQTDDQLADEVAYTNTTSGLTATDVQAALDEIDGNVDTNTTNISSNDTDIAANAGNITTNTTDIGNLETLSGVAGGTDLGTFTGVTIADASDVKGALQSLETSLENQTDDQLADEVAYTNTTSGLTATDVQGALDEIDGNVDTNVTDIAANATNIGTNTTNISSNDTDIAANTAAITSNDTDIAANAGNITTNTTDIGNLETLSGVAGGTDLGTFTGVTIADASDVKGALQSLETSLENQTDDQLADEVAYTNTTSGLTATDVQGALDEIDGNVDTNDTDIAANAGNITTNTTDIGNLETLSGVAGGTDLGTFTGVTIADASDVKGALQSLETSLENQTDDQLADEVAYTNTTSGLTATDVQGALDEIDGNVDTNATDIAANATNIGTNTTNISSNDTDIAANAGNITTNTTDIGNLETLSGVAGGTDLGTFTGVTIADASDVKGALQSLETSLENQTDDQLADEVAYTNTTSGLTATDVQGALDEIDGNVDTNDTDIAANATNIGTNTTNISSNDTDIAANTAAITSNDTDIAANAGNITTNTTDIGNLETLSGVAGGTDLGTFTGVTIADASDVKGALQSLETSLENQTDDQLANEVAYTNTTSGLTATDVQGALDEIDGNVDTNDTDIAANATNIGTNTTNISSNDTDIAANAGNITTNTTDIGNLETLSGVAGGTDLGTFTGVTIADASDVKGALQSLETSLENQTDDQLADEVAYTNTTSGLTATDVQGALDEIDGNVDTNATNIATNTTNISSNDTDIAANTAAITSNDTDIAANAGNITTNTTDIGNLETLSGVAGGTDLGTFTGVTIADASDVKGALQSLETSLENQTDDQLANEVAYTNTTSGLTATDVQGALDEIDGNVDTNDIDIAANTAAITSNDTDIAANAGNITTNTTDIGNLETLSGVAGGTDLGTFTGVTIADASDVKGALQSLETSLENQTDDQLADEVAYTNTTSGLTATDVQGALDEIDGNVDTNATNIATNTTNISSNDTDIAANTAAITSNDTDIAANAGNITTNTTDIGNLETLSGVAGGTDLGTFTGVTIADASDVKGALQSLETSLENQTDDQLADEVAYTNTTSGLTATDVQGALDEIDGNVDTNATNIATNTTNISSNDTDIAANTAAITSNDTDIAANAGNITTNTTDIGNLETLSGVAGGTDLGTFTGVTIADASDVKGALQSLETSLENQTDDQLADEVAYTNTTSGLTATDVQGALDEIDGNVDTNATNIATNTTNISSNDTDIAANTAAITSNDTDIAANAGNITTNTTDIGNLETLSGVAGGTDLGTFTGVTIADASDVKGALQSLETSLENQTDDQLADEVAYTNTTSGLTATDVQGALDEIDGNVDTNATDIAANATNIGTNTTNISSNDTDITTNAGNITTNTTDIGNLETLSGVAGGTDLGTFTGVTIADASDVKGALQSLETSLENQTDDQLANEVDYTNTTSGLTATDVQGALDEIDGNVDTNATDIAANATNIGTNTTNISSNDTDIAANTAAITSNDTDITTNAGNITTNTTDIGNLETLSGVAGGTDLGTFTGVTIADASDVKGALQSLETSLENQTDDQLANEVAYTNTTSGLTATDVQGALDEIDGNVDTNDTDIAANATNIGTNTTNISSNDTDIAANAGNITTNTTDIGNLETLSGVAGGTDLGTFTGVTIADASDVKGALQSLETSLENQTDDQLADEVAYTNTTSGLTATDVQGALDEIDGNVDTNATNIATNTTNISSNDTDIAANATNIGTNTTNISSNDTDIAANAGNITTNTTDIGNLETLSGVAGGTDLGTFTGVTIADASDVKGALQSLETSLENQTDDQLADEVAYTNTTSGLTATDVQAALDEIDGNVDTNTTNISSNDTDIAANAGNITTNTTDIGNLETLSGVAGGTDLGTFTGVTIADASDVKGALQSLETSLENQTDDQLADEVAYTNTTSGLTATDVQGALDEIDGNVDTNVTDIAANATNIGTNTTNISSNDTDIAANTAAITSNDTDIAANAGNITTNTTDIGNLETLSGVAGGTDLGTFTGVTIADASDVKGALQSLETSLENQTDDQLADEVAYTNTTSGLTATDVQGALDEIDGNVDTNDTDIAANAGNITTNTTDIGNLETLSGVAGGTDLGTFTGVTIADASDVKGALQSLETSLENQTDDQLADEVAYTNTTSGLTATDVQGALDEIDGNVDTNATDIAANATNIGTNTTNISSNDTDIAANAGNITTNTTDIGNLETLSGVAGGTDLGTFTGVTIADASDVKGALQSLETSLENQTDDQLADEVAYTNTTSGLTATDVQGALDEIDGNVDTNDTDIAANATNIGTNTTNISSNDTDIAANTAAITSNDTDIAANAGNITTNTTDIGNLETLSGVAGGTDLGTFTGVTIADASDVKGALQSLETSLENQTDDQLANEVAYTNTTSGLTATDVQGALDEIDGNVDTNATDIAANATNIGTNTTNISSNDTDIAANAGNITTNTTDIGNLETLSGVAGGTDLGTFTGVTIADASDVKGALQSLETSLENQTDDQLADEVAYTNTTSGLTATDVQGALDEIDGNVDTNATNIATNTTNISSNDTDIAANTAAITSNDTDIAANAGNITTNTTDIGNLETLSGVAGGTDLGTFTGVTIADASDVKGALQSLETSLENQTDDQLANEVDYTNTTSGLTATDVQGALDEIDGNVDTNATNIATNTTNISSNDTDIAANTAAITSNDTDIAANAGNITTNTTDIGNLETLSGVAGGTDLGTFTGVTIADASDVKGALQSLETSLENQTDDQLADEVAYTNTTSGLTATDVQGALDEIDGNVDTNATNIATNTTNISSNDTDIAANTAAITSNDTDIAANAGNITTNTTDIGNLETLSGVAGGTDLGTFTGVTIADASDVKGALQSLETSLENQTDDQLADEVAYTNTTSGLTATDVQGALDEIDGNVDTNATNIATNTTNISSNDTDIAANTAAITSNDTDIAANAGNITTNTTDIGNLETLSGVAGGTDLGTFTGVTIADASDVKGALQSLETSLENQTDDQLADEVAYTNTTSGLTATDVQGALDEIDGNVDTNATNIATNTTNISSNDTDIAANTAAITSNDTDIAANAGNITTNTTDIGNLETLSGVAGGTDLGTFTGVTIADASDVKGALQSLETSLENQTDDQLADEVAYTNTTSGLTATDVQGALDEIDGNVDTNATNIATNTTNISSNDTDIAANTAAITSNDTDIAANAGNITTNTTDIGNLETLSGVAGGTDLGTFTGVTIADASDVKGALQSLETSLENQTDDQLANEVDYTNTTSGLTATDVQGALDEIDGNVDTNATNIATNTTNISSNDTDIAANTAAITSNDTDIAANAGNITTNTTDIGNLETLSGVAGGTDLGTFTGVTIADASDVKGALQSLETSLENQTDDQLANEVDYTNTTSGLTATDVQGALDEIDGNVDTNATNIATNTTNISSNDTDIAANTAAITSNDTDITTNAGNITTNTNAIAGLGTSSAEDVGTADGNVVQVQVGGLLPVLDGSNLTNVEASSLGTLDTDDLTEGTNLYYTDARVDTRVGATSVTALNDVTAAGSGIIITAGERTAIGTNTTSVGTLETLTGAGGLNNMGIYGGAGTVVTDNGTIKTAIEELDAQVSAATTPTLQQVLDQGSAATSPVDITTSNGGNDFTVNGVGVINLTADEINLGDAAGDIITIGGTIEDLAVGSSSNNGTSFSVSNTAAASIFNINESGSTTINYESGGPASSVVFDIQDGGVSRISATSGGDLDFNGTGAVTNTSDRRLKTEIADFTGALEKVLDVQAKEYYWKESRDSAAFKDIGVIAQELQEVFPQFVKKGADGYYRVSYSKLIPVLLQAIKEQQSLILELNDKVAAQEASISELKADNESNKKDLDLIKKMLLGTKTVKQK